MGPRSLPCGLGPPPPTPLNATVPDHVGSFLPREQKAGMTRRQLTGRPWLRTPLCLLCSDVGAPEASVSMRKPRTEGHVLPLQARWHGQNRQIRGLWETAGCRAGWCGQTGMNAKGPDLWRDGRF